MTATQIITEADRHNIVITRTFDAPPELVFRALTDPDLVPRWWGPREMSTAVDRMDVRPGGVWRFLHTDPEGTEYAFNGVYHVVSPPRMLVYTFEWEGLPGHVSMETVTLEEIDGRTKVTNSSVFQTIEDRDGMVQAGMESGARTSMERLAELLATMA